MVDDANAQPSPAWMLWLGRIMSGLVVLGMSASAGMKLAGGEEMAANFTKLGYDPKLMTPIGVVELLCAILYAIPRTNVLGAALLTGYLGGATATHVRLADGQFFMPVIGGVLVWVGLVLRDAALRKLTPIRLGSQAR